MDMSLGNQSHCFRALNGRATLCGSCTLGSTESRPTISSHVLSNNSGEHRLPACMSRQLAETVFNRSVNTPECCRATAG
jgi:hypothetical protein